MRKLYGRKMMMAASIKPYTKYLGSLRGLSNVRLGFKKVAQSIIDDQQAKFLSKL
jgi:hypothetical protein